MRRSIGLILGALGLTAVAMSQSASGQQRPDRDAFGPAQAAADIILESSGADIAFLPAGMMSRGFRGNDLIDLFRFPGDTVVVCKLNGEQLVSALERSISLYPSPNSGFLQVAGLEIEFDPSAAANHRINKVTINGKPLAGKDYKVAMPISLARGGYGYFSIWDKKAIVRTLDGVTLTTLLKGKRPTEQSARWKSTN